MLPHGRSFSFSSPPPGPVAGVVALPVALPSSRAPPRGVPPSRSVDRPSPLVSSWPCVRVAPFVRPRPFHFSLALPPPSPCPPSASVVGSSPLGPVAVGSGGVSPPTAGAPPRPASVSGRHRPALPQRGSFLFPSPDSVPPQLTSIALRVQSHVAASVGSSSCSAERSALSGPSGWVTFAEQHGMSPFPAKFDHIMLWLGSVTGPPFALIPSSANSYFDAVGRAHMDRFLPFLGPLEVRAVKQFITGSTNKMAEIDFVPLIRVPKFLVTPPLVLLFFTLVPLEGSSHEDRVFLAASSFLSLRGRRGCEAWARVASRLIRWKHIRFQSDGLRISVWTKTGWFELFYPALPSCSLCPLLLFTELRRLSPFPSGQEDPVFLLPAPRPVPIAGPPPPPRPLRREFMISRTRALLALLGLPCLGHLGSKSWRAGLASASVLARLPEATTKQVGVWKSSAYLHYVELPEANITSALHTIVGLPSPSPPPSASPPLVASPPSSSPPPLSAPSPSSSSSESDSDSGPSFSRGRSPSPVSPSLLRSISRRRPVRGRSGKEPLAKRQRAGASIPLAPPSRFSSRLRDSSTRRKTDVGSMFLDDYLLASGELP